MGIDDRVCAGRQFYVRFGMPYGVGHVPLTGSGRRLPGPPSLTILPAQCNPPWICAPGVVPMIGDDLLYSGWSLQDELRRFCGTVFHGLDVSVVKNSSSIRLNQSRQCSD